MPIAVAVFDVDHTLVRGSSGGAFIGYLWKRNVLSGAHKRRFVRDMLRHRLRGRSGGELVELGARMFDGLAHAELASHATRFVAEELHALVYREALEAIERARLAGLTVVLASGSPSLVIEPLALHVGAEVGIGSRAIVREGRLTAEIVFPVPYRAGKVELVTAAFAEQGIDWSASTAYTDRAIDVPLLERVGRPVVVNPRGSIGPLALERGWRVERWRRLG
jgi:HAD superfamily hydrolase (TIGR01490 family)